MQDAYLMDWQDEALDIYSNPSRYLRAVFLLEVVEDFGVDYVGVDDVVVDDVGAVDAVVVVEAVDDDYYVE